MVLGTTFNRFLKITSNFKDLALRAPQHQLSRLKRVKKKFERYLARQNSLPAELPRINWEYYRENLGPAYHTMLTEYEQKYKAFKIPLPQHEFTAKYDSLRKEYAIDVQKYKDESNIRIKNYDDAVTLYKSLMPYSQMTMEDYCSLFSKDAPDYVNRPTFWPHTPEEQIGYVKPHTVINRRDIVTHDRMKKIITTPKEHAASIKGKVSKAPGRLNPPNHGK